MSVDDLIKAADEAQSKGLITLEAFANISLWLTEPAYADHVAEIATLIRSEQWTELDEGFYTVLEFGTGGRRGRRGVGPNRINARTIAESARGLANWVLEHQGPHAAGIVIAYDTRHASPELARVCAEVVAGAGLKALIFDGCRPTPELSFAVRHLQASAGIVVSASHNPPTDNGFKAYGPDGGQLVPPHDVAVLEAVKRTFSTPIPRIDFDRGVVSGLIVVLGPDVDHAYIEAVLATSRDRSRSARVVYTPLHGTGIQSVVPVLEKAGFRDLQVVQEEATPDGNFPHVPGNIPNPEEAPALEYAAGVALQVDADLAMGTDPDADRLGCWARHANNGLQRMTGNQIGALLTHHVLASLERTGQLRPDHLVLTTTVTTRMIGKLARRYGVGVIEDLLVGFKYVACVTESLEDPSRLIFACEESHGYLGGAYTRDKDGAGAALLLAEAASRAKDSGRDLWHVLDDIYEMVGYHCDLMHPYLSPGRTGMTRIADMLAGLRADPPRGVAGLRVQSVVDRRDNVVYDRETGQSRPLEPIRDPACRQVIEALLPARDNLIIYEFAGEGPIAGARAAVRPSGTEPKCKFYASAWGHPGSTDAAVRRAIDDVVARLRDELVALAEAKA